MDVAAYLKKQLSVYPLNRIYIRAGIELQHLKNDGIIEVGECRYLRDANGYRNGVEIAYKTAANPSNLQRTEVIAADAN